MDRHGGAGEAETVGDLAGQMVGLVGTCEHALPVVGVDAAESRVAEEVEQEVPVHRGRGEHADSAVVAFRNAAGVFECGPGGLEEQPVLGIGALGLLLGHPEERGIEVGDVAQPPARGDVAGSGPQVGADAEGLEFVGRVVVDRVDAGTQVRPERREVVGAG